MTKREKIFLGVIVLGLGIAAYFIFFNKKEKDVIVKPALIQFNPVTNDYRILNIRITGNIYEIWMYSAVYDTTKTVTKTKQGKDTTTISVLRTKAKDGSDSVTWAWYKIDKNAVVTSWELPK